MAIKYYDASGRDVHIDAPLSEILINYRPAGSVADQIFPVVPVVHQSDVFYEFSQADLWRVEDSARAPLTAAKRVDFNVTSQTHFARNFAYGTAISIEDLSNADTALALRENKSMMLKDKLTLDFEARIATAVINSSNVSTVSAPLSGVWGNHGASDPIFDLDNSIETMRAATGYRPTDLVLGPVAWRHLKRNSTLRQLIFPTPGGTAGPGLISTGAVANVFDLKRVHVAEMVQNVALEGFDQNLADVWGPHALLYYRPDRPSRDNPSFGYTFRWTPPRGTSEAVTGYFDPAIRGEIMEVGMYQDERVISVNLATLIMSVV